MFSWSPRASTAGNRKLQVTSRKNFGKRLQRLEQSAAMERLERFFAQR
jgi:hypothetical protein